MKKHIHIFGASGSGTTTIAKGVSERLGYAHFDSDNYYWALSDEPYTVVRDRAERVLLLENDLLAHEKWVLSGSFADWGNAIIPYLDLVVFVTLPHEERMERLKKREYERYGDAMLEGGSRYENSQEFLEWAALYDDGGMDIRSLMSHTEWLKLIECPVLRIVNNVLADSVETVINAVKTTTTTTTMA